MKPFTPKHIVLTVFLIMTGIVNSQFSGNNLFEVQLGNIPGVGDAQLLSNYDQLNLQYRYKNFRASSRIEYFVNKHPDRGYVSPSQFQLQYKTKRLNIRAGNFFDILGNGLLLRAWDIPGSVFESQGYRTRQGFYRDILGFSGEYNGDVFRLKAIAGQPLVNVLPPTLSWKERHSDKIYSLSPGISLGGQNLDLNYLYNRTETGDHHYSSVQLTGNLPADFSYNIEVAGELGTGVALFSGSESIHGIYASLNYSGYTFGGSLEYKNYSNFVLGSPYNDPPTLIKEQSYKVLNRSIHVPLLSDESGMQAELYYRFNSGHMLTLNTSIAKNELFKTFTWQEYFAELYAPVGESGSLKWFMDYTRDDFENEPHRFSGGGIYEVPVFSYWSILSEIEYQQVRRTGFLDGTYSNGVLIGGLSYKSSFSMSLVWEMSTDPFLTDDPGTIEIEDGTRHWIGVDTKFRVNRHHTFTVFMGQRRGGPSCTSGICYEVLDFTGVELKYTAKF